MKVRASKFSAASKIRASPAGVTHGSMMHLRLLQSLMGGEIESGHDW